jgi:putative MATE family efflux protein
MERNLTTGSVFRTILYFALPYLLSYTLQTLYGMADLFIIGQFNGVEAITAVTNGSQIMHMLTVIIVGLAMGVTVTIGRAIGAGKRGEASGIVGNTIVLFASISVVLTVVLVINVKNIVRLVGVPAEAVEGTIQYLAVCFAGIPFITAYNVISAIFRGMGDSKRPMYYIAVACVANIVIDYVLIGIFGMGALGAALGTTLSQTLSVIISLIAIIKTDTGLTLRKSDMSADRAVMSEILKIGVPVAVQDGCIQVAFIIITVIANSRGLDDAAAVGIVEKIISALFIMPSSMLATVSALASQNIGAGRQDRASQTLWYATLLAIVYGVIVTVLVEFNTSTVVGWFTADVAVITLGAQYISSYITDCIFAGVHFSFTGYFAACGKSYIGFIHNILAIALVRVPGSYLASLFYPDTLFPMGVAAPAGSLLSVLICLVAYWMLRRKAKAE